MSEAAGSDRSSTGAEYPRYFADLYSRSNAERFGLGFDQFATILAQIGGDADLHRSLHLEELALARACAAGSETAWEQFVNRYRPKLYLIAAAMTHDEASARELADSLYADLYGTRQSAEGGRLSKLVFYTGRGSLEGWLRATLARQYIDRYRKDRRLVNLDERLPDKAQPESSDPRLEQEVDAALDALSGEDRLILAAWYLDGRTLAEIGRMLGVHESTVSRRVDRIVAGVRKQIIRGLKARGISGREAEAMMKTDVRDLAVDIRGRLVQEKRG